MAANGMTSELDDKVDLVGWLAIEKGKVGWLQQSVISSSHHHDRLFLLCVPDFTQPFLTSLKLEYIFIY